MRRPAATSTRPRAPLPLAGITSLAPRPPLGIAPVALLTLLVLSPVIACRPAGDREAAGTEPPAPQAAAQAPAATQETPATAVPAPGPAGDGRPVQGPAADLPADRPLRAA